MKIYVLLLIFSICFHSHAQQKNIVIASELMANSPMMKVKMGTKWMGKIWKFKFGEYAVTDSKNSWEVTNSKTNFLNTKTNSDSERKFSFALTNNAGKSANVNAGLSLSVSQVNSLDLFSLSSESGLSVLSVDPESAEITNAKKILSAFITLSSDTAQTWTLLYHRQSGSETGEIMEFYLSNGEQVIDIIPVDSNLTGKDKRSVPALGYELRDGNRALAAVQYYGGGLFGFNKGIVWIDSRLNDNFRLTLAAAITAILEVKVDEVAPD